MKWSILLIFTILILPGVYITLANPSYIPDNQSFRPVYSQKFTGFISPEQPMKISTVIRDSETSFFRIYAWGPDQNSSDFDLWTSRGKEVIAGLSEFNSTTHGYPEVVTVKNVSSDYLMTDPGEYSSLFTTSFGSGLGEVHIQYVYHENIDMGPITSKDYSVREIHIPPGLSRIIFITESSEGTDLDLFIQKGDRLPNSYESFDYSSTSSCTDCWDTGIENWVAEMYVIDNPEPGQYLMVTYAQGGDDFFISYWMGVDSETQNQIQEENVTSNASSRMKGDTQEKYSSTPYNLQYNPGKKEIDINPEDILNKAYQPRSSDT
ncbi:MAG: hypothetical protein V1862_12880 [Methanobacteriota archaeon]